MERIAWVTGASRGIGQAIAIGLAKEGAFCVGTATTQAGADNITYYFEKAGLLGVGMQLDVADSKFIEKVHAAIKENYGTVDILVNNAAITRDNLLMRMKDEEWHDIIQTNLNPAFYLSKLCIRDMMKKSFGRIINISSVVGVTGNAGQSNYAAVKAGLIGFSKSLGAEVASRGITVNVIAPGFIDTDMTKGLSENTKAHILDSIPMKALGKPEDIANAVNFLASEQSGYMTGQTLHINGGMYMN